MHSPKQTPGTVRLNPKQQNRPIHCTAPEPSRAPRRDQIKGTPKARIALHFLGKMEASRERTDLFDKIRPPRLEDAGLEDCALPPDSIKEAFLRAATAVGYRAASILTPSQGDDDEEEDSGGCIRDPWPVKSAPSDVLVGIAPEVGPPGSCAAEKVDVLIGDGDLAGDSVGDLRVGSEEEKKDEVVVMGPAPEEGGIGDCVDGLRGLKIGGKGGSKKGGEIDCEQDNSF
ncbi:hypothetical protein Nepgr_019517 [Nepenthes gracilis]|uniref:Uncharacterized protein n=1 Tax=Nepenthes gracilis TaxID=150966 RepID=A0AAD3SX92_NEPGR|nr:hypothetical protein Nepgr_019517 [Nepenthes gracilis]